MSDVAEQEDRTSIESSTRPRDYVERADIPTDLHEEMNDLLEKIGPNSRRAKCNNLRLEWEVPAPYLSRPHRQKPTWRVYTCGITGMDFAVPDRAPVLMLRYEDFPPEAKVIHPDLVNDRTLLLERLASYLETVILDFTGKAAQSLQLAYELSEMEELPMEASKPYPDEREDQRAFEPLGERPS